MQIFRKTRFALALLVTGFLAACSADLLTGGPLIRPGEPTGVIILVNDSSISIPAVLISACSASSYGLNRLPQGMSVPPGGRYTFTVSAGCWDVHVGDGYQEARQRMTVRPGGGVEYHVSG